MHLNRTKKQILLVGVAAVLTTVSLLSQHSSAKTPVVAVKTKPAVVAHQSFRGLPARLVIPAINVNAAVEYTGRTPAGDMAVTNGSVDVGWYKYGPLPGEAGSAVMAGHVVGINGQPGIFINLSRLAPGDLVSVVDAKGQSVSFTVRASQTYNPAQADASVFNSASGTHLNLITCAGDWDAAAHHYLSRLVVFADKSP
jgi:sortase (surface protein transpeptidase)